MYRGGSCFTDRETTLLRNLIEASGRGKVGMVERLMEEAPFLGAGRTIAMMAMPCLPPFTT